METDAPDGKSAAKSDIKRHSTIDANRWEYTVYANHVEITGLFKMTSGAIAIPSERDGKPVTAIGDYAFMDCNSLMSVTIPDSVTFIGAWAFWGCSNLTVGLAN